MVDQYRLTLGATNNGNAPGPLADGRREINWDGGGSTATAAVPTPFDGFLLNRGARFTTKGSGFVQAPASGLATTFAQPEYEQIFQAFSPVRLFSAIGSNVTNVRFFIPGGGELPATTSGFGAIFSDVDQRDGRGTGDTTTGGTTRRPTPAPPSPSRSAALAHCLRHRRLAHGAGAALRCVAAIGNAIDGMPPAVAPVRSARHRVTVVRPAFRRT